MAGWNYIVNEEKIAKLSNYHRILFRSVLFQQKLQDFNQVKTLEQNTD